MLIDSHTHLYLPEFLEIENELLKRAADAGVQRYYLPAIDSSTHTDMIHFEQRHPGKAYAMMGLHPCSVKADYKAELDIVAEWLTKRTFAAIGEIGLDFYWDETFIKEQQESFHFQIDLALKYSLPIVIHTRKAMQETIDIVKEYKGQELKGIFHCFSGSYEEAMTIIEMGFFLGIGGVLTYKNAGLAEVIERIPLEHLVLETDAPYLTPVPFRGKRNESSYLKYIVNKLAELKQVTEQEIEDITTKNALSVFKNALAS